MKRWRWLPARRPVLTPDQAQRLVRLPLAAALDDTPLREQRFVVLDLETSGLNLHRDQVLSIGAVVVQDGAIDLGEQFEAVLLRAPEKPGQSVLIHGLTPGTIAAGQDPVDALLGFMEFLGDSPLLAFHAGFDRHMLRRALKQTLGLSLQHPFLDVAQIAPLICPMQTPPRHPGLDDWIAHFGLQVEQRHHASADALVTAEIALILLSRARRQGILRVDQLDEALGQRRRRLQNSSL